MSSRPPPRHAPAKPGLFGWSLNITAGIIASFVLSVVIGCMIEWVGMHYWWQQEGVDHSRKLVAEDLGYLKEYPRSLLTHDTVAFASSWAGAITAIAGYSGLLTLLAHANKPPIISTPPQTGFRVALANTLRDVSPYVESGLYVAQDAAIRASIVVLALPAFILAVMVGLVDGLARRDVRRWSGGRESAFLYHKAKNLINPAFTGGFTLYLTWPIGGFNPAWMVLPFCIAVACVISLMAATFKKYL
jgi:integrating conjugative element membrane protein (TIGR03747 family)